MSVKLQTGDDGAETDCGFSPPGSASVTDSARDDLGQSSLDSGSGLA
jgi:hypothetical protein